MFQFDPIGDYRVAAYLGSGLYLNLTSTVSSPMAMPNKISGLGSGMNCSWNMPRLPSVNVT